jgi:hypothetical protein
MLERALKLRSQIRIYVESLKLNDKSLELSNEEWIILEIIHDLLRPLKKVALRLQGQAENGWHGAFWEVLPAMQLLIKHLETSKKKHKKYKGLQSSINNALKKLYEYYQLITACPIS